MTATTRETRVAELALLVGTVFWGVSFTWAKEGAVALNLATGRPEASPLGPLLLLGVRFTLGGLLWLAIFPAARRGWTVRSFARAAVLGLLLATPMAFQVLGLLTTTEAVSAFLTSLTVLFVPLLATVALREPPPPPEWVGVLLATAGIYLMTGFTPHGFGPGEAMGLAASVCFGFYILTVNHVLPKENPHRMTAGQFLACGLFTLAGIAVFSLFYDLGLHPRHVGVLFTSREPLRALVLLVLLPTLTAYGLLNFFQPKVDPTRAALLYLAEPLFASAYAWLLAGRGMTGLELAGAGLILVANVLVEFLKPAAGAEREAEPAGQRR